MGVTKPSKTSTGFAVSGLGSYVCYDVVDKDMPWRSETRYTADGTVRNFSRGTHKLGPLSGGVYLSMERTNDVVTVEPYIDHVGVSQVSGCGRYLVKLFRSPRF